MSETYLERKICLKCGEVYRKKHFLWQIIRKSGIPYVKKEYSMTISDGGEIFYYPPFPIKLNSRCYTYHINHYDKKAVKEVENNRCIMQGCDGELKSFTDDKYENMSPEKRNKLFPKYFGEDGSDISEFDAMYLILAFPNEVFVTTGNSD